MTVRFVGLTPTPVQRGGSYGRRSQSSAGIRPRVLVIEKTGPTAMAGQTADTEGNIGGELLKPAAFVAEVGQQEMRVEPDPELVLLTGATIARSEDFRMQLVLPTVGFGAGERAMKRAEDLVVTLILAVSAVLLAILIAFLILIDDGWPAFYRQERLGRLGRPFSIHKFRTMKKDLGSEDDGSLATSDHPRLTRFGRILRRSRMDELPQLWNILVGEMSLVGPRPERPKWVERFSKEHLYYRLRLRVKPG